jgi:hypothetical protein
MTWPTVAHPLARLAAVGFVTWLTSCSSGPSPPDWALQAQASLERATRAHLSGEPRLANADHERGRQQLARTGRTDLVARAELLRCAAEFASLQFLLAEKPVSSASAQTCAAFEPWRQSATQADQAYADFLGGNLVAQEVPLLPVAQQAGAAAGQDAERRLAAIRPGGGGCRVARRCAAARAESLGHRDRFGRRLASATGRMADARHQTRRAGRVEG